MTARNRRAFLRTAGLGAYVVAGAFGTTLEQASGEVFPQSGENPDADLIALCARFDELERQCMAIYSWAEEARGPEPAGWPQGGFEDAAARRAHPFSAHCRMVEDEKDRRHEPLWDEQEKLFERIMAIQPTTLAGVKALATTWRTWDEQVEPDGGPDGYMNDRFAWHLLRSITEMPT